jgi:hypothetical protein
VELTVIAKNPKSLRRASLIYSQTPKSPGTSDGRFMELSEPGMGHRGTGYFTF